MHCGCPGPACLFASAVEPRVVLAKHLGRVAGLALWRWHGDARLLCLCEQKLLDSVVKLINLIFGGFDNYSCPVQSCNTSVPRSDAHANYNRTHAME